MKHFTSIHVFGTRFRSAAEKIDLASMIGKTTPVIFKKEPENKFDPNAIAIYVDKIHAGYVPSKDISEFSEFMAAHPNINATATILMQQDGIPRVSVTIV